MLGLEPGIGQRQEHEARGPDPLVGRVERLPTTVGLLLADQEVAGPSNGLLDLARAQRPILGGGGSRPGPGSHEAGQQAGSRDASPLAGNAARSLQGQQHGRRHLHHDLSGASSQGKTPVGSQAVCRGGREG
jgi:hypothetical protein